ncbi:MAG TPA: hypothetical protein VHB99_18840, partial [Pirellulales bacterium]|nr:hypothetical protein [Pirellulales bacterium]
MATYSDDKRPLGGQDDSELFWLAYCYVAGELSAAQVTEFEARLEVDQPAREAVAQAVELTAAVQGAPETLVEPASVEAASARRGMSPVGGWAWAMAASIALAVVGYSFLGRNALHDAAPALSPADRQLADAWAASTFDESDSEVGDESNRLAGLELSSLSGEEN